MRRPIASLALAGLMVLTMAASIFAQAAPTTLSIPTFGRTDVIVGIGNSANIPPVAAGTFSVQSRATDDISGQLAVPFVPYVQDLEAYFAARFGWRPSAPTTVLYFSNGQDLINALEGFRGSTLSDAERSQVLSRPAFLAMANQGDVLTPQGSWVILVNLDMDQANQTFTALNNQFTLENGSGTIIPGDLMTTNPQAATTNAMTLIEESIASQYSNLMIMDLAGTNGPEWFREGLADAIALSIVPGLPQETGRPLAVANFQAAGNTLPTLAQLPDSFTSLLSVGGQSFDAARGIGFLATRSLLTTLNGVPLADFLRSLGAGAAFDSQLQSSAGFDLSQLNSQYQSLIPIP